MENPEPTEKEQKLQNARVVLLSLMDYDDNKILFEELLNECTKFENKYC
jgi:hypothetical protein